jgi:hypothetical protein
MQRMRYRTQEVAFEARATKPKPGSQVRHPLQGMVNPMTVVATRGF